jgi:hypothetical protein
MDITLIRNIMDITHIKDIMGIEYIFTNISVMTGSS